MSNEQIVLPTSQRHIVKIRLENFQGHKDTVIHLKPGINLITGSSDAGKSAILRGLNWVFHNIPRGQAFIRVGTEEARVTVWFSDGCIVSRIKGASRNAIMAQSATGERMAFEKIGAEIPPEARAILGNPPMEDKNPVAYAEQLAPYFLVSLSPSELPRAISDLTGINDFEEAAMELLKKSNSAKSRAKDSSSRIDKYELDLTQYVYLDQEILDLEQLEVKSKQIEDISLKNNEISQIIANYKHLQKEGLAAQLSKKNAERIAVLGQEITPARDVCNLVQLGNKILERFNNLLEDEGTAKQRLNLSENILLIDSDGKVAKSNEVCDTINTISNFLSIFSDLNTRGKSLSDQCIEWKKKKKLLVESQNILIEEMRVNGMWCFTCERPSTNIHECRE